MKSSTELAKMKSSRGHAIPTKHKRIYNHETSTHGHSNTLNILIALNSPRTTQVRRDHGRSLVQPPAENKASSEVTEGCSGLEQAGS